MTDILDRVAEVLEARRRESPETSYVAGLYNKGPDTILKKIGEEATEVVIAGKGEDPAALVHEVADLWFHTMVLLASRDLSHDLVLAELERRFGISGLTEKAARTKP